MIYDMQTAILLCASNSYTVTRKTLARYVGGIAIQPLFVAAQWATTTSYAGGAQVTNGPDVYAAEAPGGTSGSGGGPVGQGSGIVDGGVLWDWVAPSATQFVITGSLQPLKGAELDRLAELYRTREIRALFVSTNVQKLRTLSPSSAPGQRGEADVISIGGEDWQVSADEDWDELGAFRRVLVTRVGR